MSAATSLVTTHAFEQSGWRRWFASIPLGAWLVVVLGIHASLLAWSASIHSPTLDEAFHLAGGVRQLKDHLQDIDRGNPPLVGMLAAVPVVTVGVETDWHRAPNSFLVGADFLTANGPRIFWLMTLGRWMLIPLSVWGGLVCYWWAYELSGQRAGFLAAVLWCFCPQVLTFGSLVTGDMAATVLGATTLYFFWKWLREPTAKRAAQCGLVWGLTESSKFVCLMFYPLLPLLWLAWRWDERREKPWFKTVLREFWQGLGMVLLSLSVINCWYQFEGVGAPLKSYHIGNKVLSLFGPTGEKESAFRTWLGEFPAPLPSNYLGGLDEITKFVTANPPSYLGGVYKAGGWWYFYLYGWLIKLPLGTWLIIGLACGLSLMRRLSRQTAADPKSGNYLFRAGVAMFVFVTVTSGVQFLRYTLPVLPIVLIWASQVADATIARPRWVRAATLFGVFWTVGSSLLVFPHSLSYFNEVVGGSRYGYQYLIDDSYDWGQDLLLLRRWVKAHPEAQPMKLAYWGWSNPRLAGIEYTLPPLREDVIAADRAAALAKARNEPAQSSPLTAGWYACSIGVQCSGPWIRVYDEAGYEAIIPFGELSYFRDLKPVARIGYSINVYHLDDHEASELSKKLLIPRVRKPWEKLLYGLPEPLDEK